MAHAKISQRPPSDSALSCEEWTAASPAERIAAESSWVSLITGAETGRDLWAFEQLYRAYLGPLRAFARRWLTDAEGQEAVQSAFCNLWLARRGLLVRTSVRTYLYRAIRNYAVDARRKEATATRALGTNEHDELIRLVAPPQPTPTEDLDRNEAATLCKRAIAALPDRTRIVVMLFYFYGMSRGEIAFVLDTSPDTIQNEINAAQRTLRDLVHPAGTRSPLRATLER